MIPHAPARRAKSLAGAALAALASAVVLAACSSPAPPPVAAAPPPPPAVSLSPRVIEQAAAYRAYVDKATAISPAFASGGDVAGAVRVGASYEPNQLLRGAIGYGAVAALQDKDFVASVRKFAVDPEQRRTVAYSIMKDPAYVVGISGSAGAAGQVIAALSADGQKLLDQGRAVKQAAYDVQRAQWSKADVAGRDARLQLAKQLSATPTAGEISETSRLQLASIGGAPMALTPAAASPPYTQVVIRSMAVAALAALGYADDASLEQVMPILAEPTSANCLNMSKLNLYQCLAVAKPHYEDVFCLGQHILMDTGKCIIKGVGLPDPEPTRIAVASKTAVAYGAPEEPKAAAKKKPRKR